MGKKMFARAGAVIAGGALAFAGAAPAMAQETVPLNQSNVFADDQEFDQGFGECSEVPDQNANQDVWVFVWPGNTDPEDIESLELNFDTDGDNVADETFTLDDVTPTEDAGTAKLVLVTPAGWQLIDGTSEVGGESPPDFFNLTHSCAGEAPPETTPPKTTPPEETTPPGETTPPEDEPKLPVTGAQFGGLLILGGGLLAAGLAMVAVRRRRNISDILEG